MLIDVYRTLIENQNSVERRHINAKRMIGDLDGQTNYLNSTYSIEIYTATDGTIVRPIKF